MQVGILVGEEKVALKLDDDAHNAEERLLAPGYHLDKIQRVVALGAHESPRSLATGIGGLGQPVVVFGRIVGGKRSLDPQFGDAVGHGQRQLSVVVGFHHEVGDDMARPLRQPVGGISRSGLRIQAGDDLHSFLHSLFGCECYYIFLFFSFGCREEIGRDAVSPPELT